MNTQSKYNVFLGTIREVSVAEEAIGIARSSMSEFSECLSKNEADILWFKNIASELQTLIDTYDFTEGFPFVEMKKKLETVLLLKSKLAQMANKTRELTAYTAWADQIKEVGKSKELSRHCVETMGLNDVDKCVGRTEEQTQKIDDLQKILELLTENKILLDEFQGFSEELQQYVIEAPHAKLDDTIEVRNRIEAVQQVKELMDHVESKVGEIADFSDRHSKGSVVANYNELVRNIKKGMRFEDVKKFKKQLNDTLNSLGQVSLYFDEEEQELRQIRYELEAHKPDMWREDNEYFVNGINSLLDKGVRNTSFSLPDLKNRIESAKIKRSNDIHEMVENHGWLTRKNYRATHDNLVSQYIAQSEYNEQIEYLRKAHRKKVWITIGLCIGIPVGIVIAIYLIWFLIVVAVCLLIGKMIISRNQ